MAAGSVFLTLPKPSLFAFRPSSRPEFNPPPMPGSMKAAPPVHISDYVYRAALDPTVPAIMAAVYAATVRALNAYNRSTGKKPWSISQTCAFGFFVAVHNIFLAVYSAWTFAGMFGVLGRSMVSPSGGSGLAAFADSVCRINGPAGLGNAVFYDEAAGSWRAHTAGVALGTDGSPSRNDAGRIWNEGLAFYGWLFYLSKFYEVLDTFIILAKGKCSSTLQTYHHAGAMFCMWAGMRYMSPPIWMFVFVNSGIHAMMYTYYTLTTFNIRMPNIAKRALTSLQITQFLVGAFYAMLHSFVSYTVPVVSTMSPPQHADSAASSSLSAAAAPMVPALAGCLFANIKAFIQGVARTSSPAAASVSPETRYVYAYHTVPCITTTGATFAIWFNVLYLAPLTYLFVRFFVGTYLRRSGVVHHMVADMSAGSREVMANKKASLLETEIAHAEKAGWEAEVYGQDGMSEGDPSKAENGSGITTKRVTKRNDRIELA